MTECSFNALPFLFTFWIVLYLLYIRCKKFACFKIIFFFELTFSRLVNFCWNYVYFNDKIGEQLLTGSNMAAVACCFNSYSNALTVGRYECVTPIAPTCFSLTSSGGSPASGRTWALTRGLDTDLFTQNYMTTKKLTFIPNFESTEKNILQIRLGSKISIKP